ncbi:Ger(x)C family spore germination protein [Paenibacillus qinlingensis]|uniref:Ger(x)C family spore germination protein n=1 Tax=Paenibacillus qinlingensis TaxID=1837343 RepID=UPI0015651AAB|nr:Ger(x)C family spore germination protein [Paenibacillus qinlingensis]NQX62375.1 Ger(x)C family spore germination protein [Paenibacillus qinlingensis]
MMRKMSQLMTYTMILILLTGCWDRKEINDIAILQLSAFDLMTDTGKYRGYVQVAIPKSIGAGQLTTSGGTQQKTYMPLVDYGENIEAMTIKLERKLSRDALPSHRRIFMVGESLARQNMAPFLDLISRNPKNRLRTYLVIARDTDAKSLVESDYSLEATKEEALREIIVRKMQIPSMLRNFYASSAATGIEPVAAAFSKDHDGKILLRSVALFNKTTLVGYVDDMQAIALTSLLGRKPFGDVDVALPDQENKLSVRVTTLKAKKRVKVSPDQQPHFIVEITATGRIMDNRTKLDPSDPAIMEKLDASFQEQLTQCYQKLFHTLQTTYKTDNVGLGQSVYRKYPKLWKKIEKDWETIFPEVDVQFKVDANIYQIGVQGAPYYLREDEISQ